MALLFVEDPVELDVQNMRGSLSRAECSETGIPLWLSLIFLYGRYRFLSKGITSLCQLSELYVTRVIHWSRVLTVLQTVPIALHYFIMVVLCLP